MGDPKMKRTWFFLLCMTLLSGAAVADKLPKNAVPLTPDELKAIYADKTAVWSKENQAYFAADGSVIGVGGRWYFSGKLVFKGNNEVCSAVQSTDSKTKKSDGKTYTDCWKWVKFKDKKGKEQLWNIYSKSFDNKKLDLVNSWGAYEQKVLKSGNLVAARYKKLGGN
jgi:hypothetical protein